MPKLIPPAENEFMGFGTWLKTQRGIYFCCPSCGNIMMLDQYPIGADGAVSPEVLCTNSHCKFEEMIQLQDWKAETPSEE